MQVTVNGLTQAIANLDGINQGLNNLQEPMQRATLAVTGSAKQNAPVDTGLLRSSITPSVTSSVNKTTGVVGSNVKHAPAMEYGAPPHWVPLEDLRVWARRHGTTAYVVARAIARRGLKPRYYLKRALESNADKIAKIFNDAIGRIVSGK